MIFVDYLGPAERFEQVSAIVAREVSSVARVPESQVAVRRVVTEGGPDDLELWVELSTDEQLYRLGRQLAQRVTAALKDEAGGVGHTGNVWMMYRVVPLSHAFLDGEPRGRGTPGFD